MSQSDDEKAVRAKLIAMGVGPNGGTTPPPSAPPPSPKPPKASTQPKPRPVIPRPRPKPKAHQLLKAQRPPKNKKARPKPKTRRTLKQRPAGTHPAWDTSPRQSLLDAWTRTPPRVKWLAYHLTAAGVGWRIGWVRWASDAGAWFAAGHWTSPSAWVLYGLTVLLVGAYRRTRAWAWPLAWIAAIPVSSVVVGLLLYGTDYTTLRMPW